MASSLTSRLVHLNPITKHTPTKLNPLKNSSSFYFSLPSSLNSRRRAVIMSSSSSYDKQLVAAKKAASLAARLCQNIQKGLLQSDVQSKSDKSPVTVADYGSQVLVSFVLQKELPSQAFSLVAEEDSGDLRKEESQETLQRITKLVNDTIASDGTYNVSPLTEADVLTIIDCGTSEGGSSGQHWVLDPIDGTKGFLRGDQYAIALGLLDEGKVVLGVLACPNLPLESIRTSSQNTKAGCLFSAQLSCGTYMESLDGSPPVKVQ
ncbi:inositol monophosphatase family protein [Artemisia annua]|uniref:Inositol monophosphatase family protein n=1 Tax=Artemisia annua TaxID=35608 RepID=A0A2U1LMF7_ARTAN|nr:inositol monophosphatase family protein [Artemisia annua]